LGNLAPTISSRPARRKAAAGRVEAATSLADALFTTTQQRVLALLFGQPSRSFFASELIELTGSGSGAVQRELKRLTSSGLVTVKRIGRQKHYQANPDCPVFDELCTLVRKTVAMVEPIRRALAPLAKEIERAVIYGSVVKGTDTAASDIDLLVVADDLPNEQWRVLDQAHRKRNLAEYEGEMDVDEQLVEAMLRAARVKNKELTLPVLRFSVVRAPSSQSAERVVLFAGREA